jgi:hypothetical protein
MFLDDLHWADQPSFLLIQKIVCRTPSAGSGPLLLVGGYRDNEVSPTHPLWMLLDEFRNKGVQCNSILLEVRTVHSQAHRLATTTMGDHNGISRMQPRLHAASGDRRRK